MAERGVERKKRRAEVFDMFQVSGTNNCYLGLKRTAKSRDSDYTKARKQGLQMVHRMFRILHLPVSPANFANTHQQAGAEAVTIPSDEATMPYYLTPVLLAILPPRIHTGNSLPNLGRCPVRSYKPVSQPP